MSQTQSAPAQDKPQITHEIKDLDTRPPEFASPRIIRSILIFVVVGVILYGAATLLSDYRSVLGSLTAFPIHTLALVLILVVTGWILRGWRFHFYLRQIDAKVPFVYSLKVFLAGFALTGTPGKLGEAIKGVFLKRDYGVSITRVVGIVFVERLMDLWGILLLGSFSVLLFNGWEKAFLLCAGIVVAGGAFLCLEKLYRPVLEWFGRFSFLQWISARVLGILLTGKDLMSCSRKR